MYACASYLNFMPKRSKNVGSWELSCQQEANYQIFVYMTCKDVWKIPLQGKIINAFIKYIEKIYKQCTSIYSKLNMKSNVPKFIKIIFSAKTQSDLNYLCAIQHMTTPCILFFPTSKTQLPILQHPVYIFLYLSSPLLGWHWKDHWHL